MLVAADTTTTTAATTATTGTTSLVATATATATTTTTADELAAAEAALSVAGDALFVRMRVNASSPSLSSSSPVPVDASVVSFAPGEETWSLELLDLGGRSYYDVMIMRRSSRITADMSPIAVADGFVVDTAALPKLPSDGALPAAGLRACLDGCVFRSLHRHMRDVQPHVTVTVTVTGGGGEEMWSRAWCWYCCGGQVPAGWCVRGPHQDPLRPQR